MKKMMAPSFWDSSALVPLCCQQPQTKSARQVLRLHAKMVVWWATNVECLSALSRLERMRQLTAAEWQQAAQFLSGYQNRWTEIAPTLTIRSVAERLLQGHDLRAADALQLAAAISWCTGFPKGRAFICADKKLAEAALKEGFNVTFLK